MFINKEKASAGPKGKIAPRPAIRHTMPVIIPIMPAKSKNGTKSVSGSQVPATQRNLTSPNPSASFLRKIR
jgi:hypothetical protein